jgi:O-antigen/teichoic acid export membrane protein
MIFSNFATMVLSILTGALQARLLGPAGRGELAQIQLWGFFLIFMGHLDIPNALTYYASRDPSRIGALIGSAWAVMLPLGIGWLLLGIFVLPLLMHGLPADIIQAAQLFMLGVPLGYINMVNTALLGMKKFGYWSLFRIHTPLLFFSMLVLYGILGTASPIRIAMGYLLILAIAAVLIVVLLRMSRIYPERPRMKYMRDLVSYGTRSILGTAPDMLNARMDQLVLALLLPSQMVGLYVVSVSWSLTLTEGLFKALGTVLFPYLAGEQDPIRRNQMMINSLHMSSVVAVLLSVSMAVATPFIFPLLFGAPFAQAIPVAIILVEAAIFHVTKAVIADCLRGLGHPGKVALAEIAALIITIGGLILTARTLGIVGAALTSLVAYAVATAIMVFFLTRYMTHELQTGVFRRTRQ